MRLRGYEAVRGGAEKAPAVVDRRHLDAWELTGFWERLAGLMAARARQPPATAVFPRCRSVHTCAMGFAVDVAFVGPGGEVVRVVRACGPWRLLACKGASMAVERPAKEGPWLEVGDLVRPRQTREGEKGEQP